MIQLSLQHINDKSPYKVTPSEDGLDFITDFGVHYRISFTEESPIGNCDTYQFMLRKVENVHAKHDPKVEATVLAIIDEFFLSNLNVLLYICDTSDGREAKRNRLFLMWFERNAEPNRFTIRTAQANIEEETLYLAIIVENRNSRLQEITEEFDATAEALTNKPE